MPRVIPETIVVDVTLSQIVRLEVVNDTQLEVHAFYEVFDDQGARHHTGEIVLPISGASLQSLRNWVDNNVLPAINAQEGMS